VLITSRGKLDIRDPGIDHKSKSHRNKRLEFVLR
jgi:hypothetical protein